ncbi:hypothetical protein GGTG_03956 [Gaeumannomyces tritici R3-111a-1]|uniref:Uncharacterized protein n=1 Tax=Gaeumannomyces tritici (strain R3-111a-1) TaxID=644352 RepID=J3NRQ6_GAET3|nr:hypothetical protein GGTG_03956 [Gaeumannomyces tritici R3-111a-1]EJT78862.1 hypothetical protein GGTG_03956 [Gaeumannomyces tritici R3-111a-1]
MGANSIDSWQQESSPKGAESDWKAENSSSAQLWWHERRRLEEMGIATRKGRPSHLADATISRSRILLLVRAANKTEGIAAVKRFGAYSIPISSIPTGLMADYIPTQRPWPPALDVLAAAGRACGSRLGSFGGAGMWWVLRRHGSHWFAAQHWLLQPMAGAQTRAGGDWMGMACMSPCSSLVFQMARVRRRWCGGRPPGELESHLGASDKLGQKPTIDSHRDPCSPERRLHGAQLDSTPHPTLGLDVLFPVENRIVSRTSAYTQARNTSRLISPRPHRRLLPRTSHHAPRCVSTPSSPSLAAVACPSNTPTGRRATTHSSVPSTLH